MFFYSRGPRKVFENVFDLKETFSLSLIRGFNVLAKKKKTPGLAKHEIQNKKKEFENFTKH
jgi:hypothetical protein